MSLSRPCRCVVCGRGYWPQARVGKRQRTCGRPACVAALRERTQAGWRERHPGYFIAWRAKKRATRNATEPVEPPRVPSPLTRLPWELAQEEFGVVGADFLASMGRLVMGHAKDEIRS